MEVMEDVVRQLSLIRASAEVSEKIKGVMAGRKARQEIGELVEWNRANARAILQGGLAGRHTRQELVAVAAGAAREEQRARATLQVSRAGEGLG